MSDDEEGIYGAADADEDDSGAFVDVEVDETDADPRGSADEEVLRAHRSPKDGRTAITVYVGERDEERLMDLEHEYKKRYGRTEVSRLDVYAAVIKAGLDEEQTVDDVMHAFGYRE